MCYKRRKILVEVVCPHCGKVRMRERRDLNKYSHYCKACVQKDRLRSTYATGRQSHNKEMYDLHMANPFNAQDLKILPKSKIRRIHQSAINRGHEWRLSAEFLDNLYVKQQGKCSLTGLPLVLNYGKNSISIDRIDSAIGYLESNVQLVIKEANFMKQVLTMDELLIYCQLIINNLRL